MTDLLPASRLLEDALSAMAEVQEGAEPGYEPDVAIVPAGDWRVFIDAHAHLLMLWSAYRDSPYRGEPVSAPPEPWTDAKLRGIASDYFEKAEHWPAAMLCMRHLLMEQRAAKPEPVSAPTLLRLADEYASESIASGSFGDGDARRALEAALGAEPVSARPAEAGSAPLVLPETRRLFALGSTLAWETDPEFNEYVTAKPEDVAEAFNAMLAALATPLSPKQE